MSDSSWFRDERQLLGELRIQNLSDTPLQIEGYEKCEEIARGGQGIVYRAVQTSTQRIVAIKILNENVSNLVEGKSRFEREIELVSMLEHPGIVRIYDSGRLADDRLFAIMEFIDGIRLDDYAEQRLRDPEAVVELFLRICEAVAYSHRKGIIHRDLKPSNILVTEDGQPHVMDFGIARGCDSVAKSSTVTGGFIGTLAFASPEQIGSDPNRIDLRTDVYSLGVILYFLLARRFPYPVDRPLAEVIDSIRTHVPQPPLQDQPQSHRDLDAIAMCAIEKNADDRFSNVDAMIAELRRFQRGEALDIKRDRSLYVLGKAIRRHRWKFAAAIASFLLTLTFSVIVTGLWQRALVEEQKTRDIKLFWEDTLGSVAQSREGDSITFEQVLDEAVHWVEVTTEGQPEIEASLRMTIGNGYRNLSQFEKADRQLQKSLQIRRQIYADGAPEILAGINSIALLRQDEQEYEEAERLFVEVLETRQRRLGSQHLDVSMARQNLGRLMLRLKRYEEAEENFRQALQIRQRHYDSDHPAIASVLFNLGDLSCQQKHWNAAEQRHENALKIRRARLSESHPDIARSLLALSRVKLAREDFDSAARLAREALRLRQSSLGPDHRLCEEVESQLEQIEAARTRPTKID